MNFRIPNDQKFGTVNADSVKTDAVITNTLSLVDIVPKNITVQATNISTTVPLTTPAGRIITRAVNAAAGSFNFFTVTNPFIKTDSVILMSITDYTGDVGLNGIPVILNYSTTVGQTLIYIANAHSTNALIGQLIISYLIV